MIMMRSFFPVGQGAFYGERFSNMIGDKEINVVYDCGSLFNKEIVEQQIRNNFNSGEIIHALFISHLDEDHMNGIPYLLKYCEVKKIFFPLLTNKNRRFMTLYNIMNNVNDKVFAVSFLRNPNAALDDLNLSYSPSIIHLN